MRSFNGLGIGLSVAFVLILMGVVAVLWYLLWRKKRTVYSSNSVKIEVTNSDEDVETGSSKSKSNDDDDGEEGAEAELMRMYNLRGPPRSLFTIKEESSGDLESEDGRSSGIGEAMTEAEAEANILQSSPPPTLKFLKDAEEKFMKTLLEQEQERKGKQALIS